MRRKIPSTNALISFEAAARPESFTKAAEELSLTQSAICRQISALEEFLGIQLFRRTRRGVKLSEAGTAYARRVTAQLDAVERDTLAVMSQQGAQNIELAVGPSFGTQWLLPRLAEFQRQQPQITINLSSRTRPFLFADTEFDAAIHFGDGDWSGSQAHFLMRENAQPVCSPRLLGTRKQIDAQTLAQMPLLQQSTRPYAWRQWFAHQGLNVPQDLSGARYELFSMLAQAASHGMGVALIPPFLIERELADGHLVVAHQQSVPSDNGYYLIVPERKVESAALRAFRDWLLPVARTYQPENSANAVAH